MKTIRKIACMLLSCTLFFASCSKEVPAGPQGLQGEKGERGQQGPKGPAGTANIIYSDWLEISFSKLYPAYYVGTINAPELTQDILDKGDIAVYQTFDNKVYKLPHGPHSNNNLHVEIDYLMVGEIHLKSATEIPPGRGIYFRYALVPGGVPASSARSSSTVSDLKDYHAVCQYYGIPE